MRALAWRSISLWILVVVVFGMLLGATAGVFSRVDRMIDRLDRSADPAYMAKLIDKYAGEDRKAVEIPLRALLEHQARAMRLAHVNAGVVVQMWTRIIGFLSAAVMCGVGCIFILGRIKIDPSTVNAEATGGFKVALVSTSPGLILTGLGTLLFSIALLSKGESDFRDANLYMGQISKIEKVNAQHASDDPIPDAFSTAPPEPPKSTGATLPTK